MPIIDWKKYWLLLTKMIVMNWEICFLKQHYHKWIIFKSKQKTYFSYSKGLLNLGNALALQALQTLKMERKTLGILLGTM